MLPTKLASAALRGTRSVVEPPPAVVVVLMSVSWVYRRQAALPGGVRGVPGRRPVRLCTNWLPIGWWGDPGHLSSRGGRTRRFRNAASNGPPRHSGERPSVRGEEGDDQVAEQVALVLAAAGVEHVPPEDG